MDIINWKQNLDEKKLPGVFSSDMSKAFDSLHSPLLIAKLRAFYGFSDELLGLIQSHFCERKCRVRIDPETTRRGLPARIFLWTTLMQCIPKWFALPGEKLNFIHVCRWPSMELSHTAETIKEVEQKKILNEERSKASQWYDKNVWKVISPNVRP